MIRLAISWYSPSYSQRLDEIIRVLDKNAALAEVDEIVCLTDDSGCPPNRSDKLRCVPYPKNQFSRPTFADYASVLNRMTRANDINVIANADIALTHSISIATAIDDGTFIALTRYNQNRNGDGFSLWMVPYSQDVWAWRGMIHGMALDFHVGRLGCDNRIAFEAWRAGYDVINPSEDIVTHHYHRGNPPAWFRVPSPYLYISPHSISDEPTRTIIIDRRQGFPVCDSEADELAKRGIFSGSSV